MRAKRGGRNEQAVLRPHNPQSARPRASEHEVSWLTSDLPCLLHFQARKGALLKVKMSPTLMLHSLALPSLQFDDLPIIPGTVETVVMATGFE